MSPRTIHDIPAGALGRSRYEAALALREAGVGPEAASAILAGSAPERHRTRIREHVEHALAAAMSDEGIAPVAYEKAPPEIVALAIGLLLLDAVGPVPRPGERAPRVRHRAFRHGCGPITGNPGPVSATHAAEHAAIQVLAARLKVPTPGIVLEPGDGVIRVVVAGVGARTVGYLRISPDDDRDCQPCGWIINVCWEALARHAGTEPAVRVGAERAEEDRRSGRHPLDLLRSFGGDANAWGALWTRATAQSRLETTLSRWARVIAELPAGEEQAPPPIVGADDRRPSMARAFAWIEQLELPASDRQAIADDLALGLTLPVELESKLRVALARCGGRAG